MTQDVAEQILTELKSLRSEIAFLIPTESLDEYVNAQEVNEAYESTLKELNGANL
jgi:hypothetical protein